jgi:hypothetical protein
MTGKQKEMYLGVLVRSVLRRMQTAKLKAGDTSGIEQQWFLHEVVKTTPRAEGEAAGLYEECFRTAAATAIRKLLQSLKGATDATEDDEQVELFEGRQKLQVTYSVKVAGAWKFIRLEDMSEEQIVQKEEEHGEHIAGHEVHRRELREFRLAKFGAEAKRR